MLTSVKQKNSDRVTDEFSESKFKPNPIPLFLLASILVHGIGLVLFSLIERSQQQAQLVPETAPIDFVIVPPEESPSQTSSDPLPQKETLTNKAIEPETPTPEPTEPIAPEPIAPEPIEPISPSPAAAVPEPIPEPVPPKIKPPKELKTDSVPPPEPITPPLPDNIVEEQPNSSEILSGLDPVREETEIKTPEITKLEKSPVNPDRPEDSSVATRLPPKITPTQPSAPTQPATPPSSPNKTPTGSGAASLLGGNLKRSYDDDKGGSFFNLDNNSSQYAANPELDVKQRLDMRNYFSEIKRRVRRNWNPNYAVQEYTTVLTFSIQRNGQIALLKVRRTSGSPEVDSEALAAVQNSGPFDPLPANYPSEMLNVEFNFNIYLYQ